MQVAELVSFIRDFLHDPDGDRWTNNRIVFLINAVIADITKKAKLKTTSNLPLHKGTNNFRIHGSSYIAKAYFSDKPCTNLLTDKCVCDKYKIKATKDTVSLDYTKDTTNYTLLEATPKYGAVNIFNTTVAYGKTVVPDNSELYGIEVSPHNPYGIFAGFAQSKDMLVVDYVKNDIKVDIPSDLGVMSDYYMLIKYYVCGTLLREDKDSNSRTLGDEELKLYRLDLAELKRDSFKDFNASSYEIKYRTIVEGA